MEIRCQKDQKKVLKIHIPAWGQKDFNVSVNGKVLADTALHDGYMVIDADSKAGDVIRLELPMEFRVLDNKSDAAFVNLAYGPYILAALSEEKEFITAPAVEEIHMVDGKLQFEANGMKLYHTFAKIRDLNKIFLTDSAKQWIILHSNHM